MLRDALARSHHLAPEQQPTRAWVLVHLAAALRRNGAAGKALALAEQTLAIYQPAHGASDATTIAAHVHRFANLDRALAHLQRLDAVEPGGTSRRQRQPQLRRRAPQRPAESAVDPSQPAAPRQECRRKHQAEKLPGRPAASAGGAALAASGCRHTRVTISSNTMRWFISGNSGWDHRSAQAQSGE